PVTVVWWDPLLLDVKADNSRGLRRDDLISKEAAPEDVAADRARYEEWRARKLSVIESAARPSMQIVTATEWAHQMAEVAAAAATTAVVEGAPATDAARAAAARTVAEPGQPTVPPET